VIGASLSIAAVLVVILFITASVSATLLVALCVLLVDLYLLAMIFYWGLTFNSIVVVNICIAIGLSVDYSAHIAHTYLVVQAPAHLKTKPEKRKYKAAIALSQMGSSVFHGGFSTFLAIAALGPSKSYIFEVFFKCWFSIIFFGMANGFFLLPVILSYMGPTDDVSV
jgi:Niemann-Pick C1 protein